MEQKSKPTIVVDGIEFTKVNNVIRANKINRKDLIVTIYRVQDDWWNDFSCIITRYEEYYGFEETYPRKPEERANEILQKFRENKEIIILTTMITS